MPAVNSFKPTCSVRSIADSTVRPMTRKLQRCNQRAISARSASRTVDQLARKGRNPCACGPLQYRRMSRDAACQSADDKVDPSSAPSGVRYSRVGRFPRAATSGLPYRTYRFKEFLETAVRAARLYFADAPRDRDRPLVGKRGNTMTKRVIVSLDSTWTVPPCASAIVLTMANPSPAPSVWRLRDGSPR
jgi:hypothetical protein